MYIEHVAILTKYLEIMREFYETYFNGNSSPLYTNPKTQFQSYFIQFKTGSRLELTKKRFSSPLISESRGLTHLAMAVGTKDDVDRFSEKLQKDGYPLLSGPRVTGDGYYEAVIQDPEGNLIEITTDSEE